jgi:hypothetical protein
MTVESDDAFQRFLAEEAALAQQRRSVARRDGTMAAGMPMRLPAAILTALACAGAATTAVGAFPQSAASRLSAGRVVASVSDYVRSYQEAFSFLIANEHYVQRASYKTGREHGSAISEGPRWRTMRGELFLTYLGADRRWIALHDVAEVDGLPVEGRDNLRALLAASPVQSVAARLFRHNARYNIGTIARNFNEPTLALQVLEPRNRARFEFRIVDIDRKDPDVPLVTLGFRERERPTIVRNLDGGPVFSSGEMIVEAARGIIRWTRIKFRHESVDAELTTTFEWDDRLDLWLPTTFAERYSAGPREGRPPETITGTARYDDYRRFEATGRIAAP